MKLPVVLLHGCGGSPEQAFERTGWPAALAARGLEALPLRLPGHGHGVSHDPADYADLAGTVLAGLPPRCHVVGFSLGAKIALAIAVRAPERLGRMVLGGIGDNVFAPETVGEAAARALEQGPEAGTPPGVLAFLAEWDPSLNDPQGVAAVLRRPPNPEFTETAVAAIRVPLRVVNGAEDFVMQMGTRLFDALGTQPHLLPGVGHFDLTAQPAFSRLAAEFLEE